jgi:hypothetical protein
MRRYEASRRGEMASHTTTAYMWVHKATSIQAMSADIASTTHHWTPVIVQKL